MTTDQLRKAAQAVVDRWDSPNWGGSAENLKHTGEYIAALRAALAQQDAQEVLRSTSPTALRPYDPTEQMRWAAKQLDPALTHEQIRAMWCAMWSAAPTPPVQQDAQAVVALPSRVREAAYDQIDRFLRNNLHDDDYADYSAALDSLYAAPTPPAQPTQAATDVLAERRRQIEAEGWTSSHDDEYLQSGSLAAAAACYALSAAGLKNAAPSGWPWSIAWWKPTTPRRDLVKAGALILAEIERLDRQAATQGGQT